MTKLGFVIIAAVLLQLATDHCQASSSSESKESPVQSGSPQENQAAVNPEEYLLRRRRRQDDGMNIDTAATVLSILPLDRIGTIVGQIMGTGLKEMFNPDVGKKLINVIENQAPLLLTSLFTNLYSNLRLPVRPTSTNSTSSSISLNNNGVKQVSNASTSEILTALRRPGAK